ncbi:MAG: AfsR/SARP family transcriptional regulator, partial [Alphaproteobacteria bacterium]
ICSRNCEGVAGFKSCRPYSSPNCYIRRKDGSRVNVALNSVAVPRDRNTNESAVAIIFISEPAQSEGVSEESDTRLHIHTLGRFAVSLRGCCLPLEQWPRKQAVQLLKFLVVHAGRPLHRERLVEMLWPDADENTGWSRLKVTVHFLRQRLREAGLHQDIITTTDSSYVLRSDCVWVDSAVFETLVSEGRAHHRAGKVADALHAFEEARGLYAGDYMEADLYADWCAEDRERFSELHVETLNALAELHFAQGEYAAAAQECHTVLVSEPCRESVHRLLMQSLIALQRPDSAVKQFRRCEEALARELGVAPAVETIAVIAALGDLAETVTVLPTGTD